MTESTSSPTTPRSTAGGDAQVRVAVVFHSGFGHTARQAEAVARGAGSLPGTHVDLVKVEQDGDELLAVLDRADAIIFGAPTYMGAASAAFKQFSETTSKAWGDGLRWSGKVAAGFTNSQNMNGNKENTLLEMFVLAAQHGMHWVSLGLYGGWNTSAGSTEDLNRLGAFTGAMAQSDGDAGPDVAPPASDLATAEHLGQRVAQVAGELKRGRAASASPAGPQVAEPSAQEQAAYTSATTHGA